MTPIKRAIGTINQNDKIHIALTFDDNFWAPTYATMRGICATTARRGQIAFHLVHTGLSAPHREKLETVHDEYGAEVHFYDIGRDSLLQSKIRTFPRIKSSNFHDVIYARLFLADIVPDTVKKLIYIDSDILVRVAIEQFYDIDLEDNVLAAANCPQRVMFQSHRDLVAKDYFRTEDPYFNSGLLLIDTEKYKAVDFAAAITENVPPDQLENVYYDQDILNIALRGRVKVLDSSWNVQNPLPAHEVLDPKIVHYTGKNKPWRLFSSTAFKRQYRHTMTNDVYYRFMRDRAVRRFRRLFGLHR